MVAILFALLALVGWGSGDIFGGIVARRIGASSTAFWLYLFGMALCFFYAPFASGGSHALAPSSALLLIALAGLGLVSIVALYEGMRAGNAALAGALAGSYSWLTVVLALLLFGETLSRPEVGALLLTVGGVVLVSVEPHALRTGRLLSDRAVPFGLLSMSALGVYFAVVRVAVRRLGWFWPAFLPAFVALPALYLVMHVRGVPPARPRDKCAVLGAVLNAGCLYGGLFAYNAAVAHGETAVVAPIAGTYPALFVLLAAIVFKNRLSGQQLVGVAAALAGGVGLAVASG